MTKILTHRLWHFIILFVLLVGALSLSGSDIKFRNTLKYLIFDQYLVWKPRPASDQVMIVDIDDESLERVGQWQWPRTKIAELVDRLSELGAKVIAFDGVLAEPDRTSPDLVLKGLPEAHPARKKLQDAIDTFPNNDAILARSIQESGRFVAGFTYGQYQNDVPVKKPILTKADIKEKFLLNVPSFNTTAAFLPLLIDAAQGNGTFMAKPEGDGIIRRTALIMTDGKKLYPSLSLESLRLYATDGKEVYKIWKDSDRKAFQDFNLPYRIVVGDLKVPIDTDGMIYIHFRSFSKEEDYVSAYKAIDPAFHAEIADKIKDKIILIGSSAEGLKDLRSSPLDLFIPGVEVHANVVEQVLQGRYLYRSNINVVAEASFILAGGLLMIMLAPFVSAIALLLLCLQLIAVAFLGSWLLFREYGILLDPVYPSLSVFVIYIASSILTYLRVEAEKKQVRDAFGLYISPDFMKELTKDPGKLQLGGEIRELSVMFTDIRSFTSISESLKPEQLIQLMNDFLTPMSDLVMSHRGTIDKYMGDAMMAFWNAPLDDPDHARHACRTALGMNATLEPINVRVKEQALKEGRPFVPLNAGIGINTGPCSVGNMGSQQRFAYSALGDAVNLASRLEGQTKEYGVNILISEETANHVPDFALLELDLIQVKGKREPVKIFSLIGDERRGQDPAFLSWKDVHDDMLRAYRSGDFTEAENILLLAKERARLDLIDYYVMMMGRIEEFQKNPPGSAWNGVYVATSK